MDANRDFRSEFDYPYGDNRSLDADLSPIDDQDINDQDYGATSYQGQLNRYGGNRGIITTRPSRDSIVRSYSEQAAARARNARMVSQKTYHDYQVNSSREKARQARREELRSQGAICGNNVDSMRASRGFRDDLYNDPAQNNPSRSSQSNERSKERPRTAQRHHVGRVARPLTSEESRAATRRSMEMYDRERASRDVLSQNRISRTPNREVIDARGSVDSRAFNEFNELVGYSIDDRDRPQPFVDSTASKSRWKSHAGQGFDGTRDRSSAPVRPTSRNSGVSLSNLSNTISGKDSYGNPKAGIAGLPAFVKIAVPVIVVLIIILLVIVFG